MMHLIDRRQVLIRISYLIIILGLLYGSSEVLLRTFAKTPGNSPNRVLAIPTPTPPAGGTIGLSSTSGPPGTNLFIAASGYTPGEAVEPFWNYSGNGKVIAEKGFYDYNPTGIADLHGDVHESFFVPQYVTGYYTIAAIGLKSNIVKTATFHLIPSLDIGIYIGNPGTVLRFNGWGFGLHEKVSLYWNWTTNNPGQQITTATADGQGDFSKRTFAIPSGTANGTYTVAGIGQTSQTITQAHFIVGTPPLGGQPGASDWSNFGYNLQGTRVNSTENIISPSNVSNLALKWRSPTTIPYRVTGSPILANGIVYVGTIEGIVIAYDAVTGNVLWTFYARGPIYGSPTIQNGIAYFGSGTYPAENLIGNFAYALNATTGSLVWENYLPYGGVWVTPLVSNGRVYFSTAYKEAVSGGFSAFDALTGLTLWSFSTPYGIWAPDTLDPTGNNLYVGTGNPCFTQPNPTNCGGYLEDLNPVSGAVIWQIHFQDVNGDDDVPTSPLYDNGKLYLGVKNGIFYCVDANNGNIMWQYNTGYSGDFGIFSNAALYNNMVFFGGGDQLIHALNIDNGSVAWTFTTGSRVFSSPSIANGVLYVGSNDKYIYALDPVTGSKLWSFKTLGSVRSSPTISNGVLYIASDDGYVYAFSLAGK